MNDQKEDKKPTDQQESKRSTPEKSRGKGKRKSVVHVSKTHGVKVWRLDRQHINPDEVNPKDSPDPDKESVQSVQGKNYTTVDVEAENLTPIPVVYTIGLWKTSIRRLIEKLVEKEINIVIDMRTDDARFAPGFVKDRDLAILLKEAANIDYRREEVLLPGKVLISQYKKDSNWKRFSEAFLRQLKRQRVHQIIDRELFTRHVVAFLGSNKSPETDFRSVPVKFLQENWGIENIYDLYL